jgi:hypothetical protein
VTRRNNVTRSTKIGARRAATLFATVTAASALLVSGCGAGPEAETATKVTAVPGASGQTDSPDNSGPLSVQNAVIVYRDPAGYPVGSDAALDVRVFNDSAKVVTVTITTDAAQLVAFGGSSQPSATPSAAATTDHAAGTAPASAAPTASPSSTDAAALEPARFEVPAGGFVAFGPDSDRVLQLVKLNRALKPGESVKLVFDFGNGARIELNVPVGVPLSPAPRASAAHSGGEGH